MAEYQYPMAHRIIKPLRPYVPSWRQDVNELQKTLDAERMFNPIPKLVNVGSVVHGVLIPPAAASIKNVNLCNELKFVRPIAEIKA